MDMNQLQEQREKVKADALAIDAQIKENHRAWVVDRVSTSLADRVTLDARLAAAMAEKQRITIQLNEARESLRQTRRATHLAALIQLLSARGLDDLVEEARVIAEQVTA